MELTNYSRFDFLMFIWNCFNVGLDFFLYCELGVTTDFSVCLVKCFSFIPSTRYFFATPTLGEILKIFTSEIYVWNDKQILCSSLVIVIWQS